MCQEKNQARASTPAVLSKAIQQRGWRGRPAVVPRRGASRMALAGVGWYVSIAMYGAWAGGVRKISHIPYYLTAIHIIVGA